MKAEYFEPKLQACDVSVARKALEFFIQNFVLEKRKERARFLLIEKLPQYYGPRKRASSFDKCLSELTAYLDPRCAAALHGQDAFPQVLASRYNNMGGVYITGSEIGTLSLAEAASIPFTDALFISIAHQLVFYFSHEEDTVVCHKQTPA